MASSSSCSLQSASSVGVMDVAVGHFCSLLIRRGTAVEQVDFVDHECHRHAVGLRRCQESVDEGGGCGGVGEGENQARLVDVGREDACFLREVARTPDYIVLSLFYFSDVGCAVGIDSDLHAVAHGDRIGSAYPFEPEIAFYAAVDFAAVAGKHSIVASGVFNDHAGDFPGRFRWRFRCG